MSPDVRDITNLLMRKSDDSQIESQLATILNERMKRIARKMLRNAGRRSPLWDTVGLADDVLLKLLRGKKSDWKNREEFFATATKLMQWQLTDYARKEFLTEKRGKHYKVVSLNEMSDGIELPALLTSFDPISILILDELTCRLKELHPKSYEVLTHHVFGQYTLKDIADIILNVSYETVKGRWRVAKLFLEGELRGKQHD